MASYRAPEISANDEPLLHELLEDPIAQVLMQRDGVERHILDPMIEEVTSSLISREVA